MSIKKNTITSLVISILVFVSSAYIFLPQKIKASSAPASTTGEATGTTATETTLNGNITSTGSEKTLVRGFNYGPSTNYGQFIAEQSQDGFSTGAFSKSISNLTCGTTYHYRSYAANSVGMGYGSDAIFTTTNTGTCPPAGSGNQPPPTTNNTGDTGLNSNSQSLSISSIKSFGTVAFGGKVKKTTIPMVTCEGSGTIFVLSSNLTGAATKVAGAALGPGGDTQQKIQKASAIMRAIADTIPFYSTDSGKNPKVGDMIMGKAKSTPDFSTCKMQIGPYLSLIHI